VLAIDKRADICDRKMNRRITLRGRGKTMEAGAPLYLQVAQLLQGRIQSAEYPVGTLLPTEFELAAALGVSRQTVRQAIQRLRQQGLVSSRKRVGTKVEARKSSVSYQFSLQSLDEIFHYASETVFEVCEEEDIAARGKLAARLGCKPGRMFHRIGGLRRIVGGERPLGWVDVWVDGRYASIVKGARVHRTAVFSLIERHSGETVVEVTQAIHAIPLPQRLASRLDAVPGVAALEVTRRYFSTGARLLEMAVSVFPGDRFGYSMTLSQS
jgi:DNA-binding GntR family transcriptional regulator